MSKETKEIKRDIASIAMGCVAIFVVGALSAMIEASVVLLPVAFMLFIAFATAFAYISDTYDLGFKKA